MARRRRRVSFKSCPRVGGIFSRLRVAPMIRVSSRAPVWGASEDGRQHPDHRRVSSRAPVWGASPGGLAATRRRGRFKSCPRVGGIIPPSGGATIVENVSSRAPVWGASMDQRAFTAFMRVSSRAPVWGASWGELCDEVVKELFQVVPPCGGHPGLAIGVDGHEGVSSRAPVWGASWNWSLPAAYGAFQVVPPCGGHPAVSAEVDIHQSVSSRAPVWGASRSILQKRDIAIKVSSRAPVWGASLLLANT